MAGEAKKLFAASEVAFHASRKDCWVVIGGKVYDVTKFLEDHPGGEDVLLHASASGDATEAFEEVGHSTSAISMMDSYLIGSIKGYVHPSASKSTDPWGLDAPPNSRTMPGNKGPPNPNTFLDFLLPLFVLGLAFAAWYYLTFVSKHH
ncbi:Cytochrome b5 [Dichanthelium oligosanthes]|uniref:Cytochrome b5 n=1 Tax=Dichanthelium oligosanthes TaxID=888268 RepID=A0A1E5W7H8_9POAL|nr:Cytochrome b5 [Dichanthelium oligosanthes]